MFQTTMSEACCFDQPNSCYWCLCQSSGVCAPCTQYQLRSKVLDGDMSKYSCFQGQFTICCCIKAGACQEKSCPEVCLLCESTCCNAAALSASRITVMDQYDLQSDPCDIRIIRFNNCCQMLSCFCHVLAVIVPEVRDCAKIIDTIADIVYAVVSGCMTAQVANELNFHKGLGSSPQGISAPVNDMGKPVGKY
jgi:hypothetical protein